jgi:serine/threonine-protein kinase
VVLLPNEKANRATLVRHLSRWLPQEAKGAELVVLYFAGHGTVEAIGSREEGYLLPHDADPDDIVTHGVAMGDVARWIDAIDARAVIVCLDCCHAGGILPASGMSLRASDRDMQLRPSVIQQLGGRGRFLIASCDRGQKSIEAEELRHGLFTYHLLKGLAGAGDRDGDGCVGVAELFNYIAGAVSRDARGKFAREQTPWTWATYNEDVILSVVREKSRSPRISTQNIAEATTDADTLLHERLKQVRRRLDASELPFVFRHLSHRCETVRGKARQALSAFPWERVVEKAEQLVKDASEDIQDILDGLEALESHTCIVTLLDHLAALLRGNLRDRAMWLLDRKRLALERERLAEVFRETKSIYEIVKVLGPGTYTGAYLARQEMTGLEVVVRVLRGEFATQPIVRSHFLELGTKAVRLVHQNLVLTREVRSLPASSLYFTVRDYIRGVTLREVLESGRRFDVGQVCKILRQVLDALAPLHREGIVHSGIKPSNIFLMRDDHVVLGDPSLPLASVGVDMPRLAYDFRYSSPELFRAGGVLTPSSDYYSLGCVAFELFEGRPPFVSDSPFEQIARQERDPLPAITAGPRVEAWLRRLLAKAPGDRFASLELLRQELDSLAVPATHMAMPTPDSPTMAPGIASCPLLHEQSFVEFEDRHSLIPLTGGDGAVWSGPDAEALSIPDGPASVPGYEIINVLGRGGMGVVYRARDVRLDRIVALKMILGGGHAGTQERQRFLSEAKAAASIPHPGIVQVYEFGMHEGLAYFALEFCPGGSLSSRLAGTPLPADESAQLVSQIARAMQAAHEHGIIHRDLKPANVLLDANGQPKVGDFGLARRLHDEMNLTMPGAIIGTPSYMSPEQATGKNTVGPQADIYSLGAILYECLTGRPPFRGHNALEMLNQVVHSEPVPPRKVNATVPRELEAICLKCLQKDPGKRYPSASALADDLEQWRRGEPIATHGRRKSWRAWWPF